MGVGLVLDMMCGIVGVIVEMLVCLLDFWVCVWVLDNCVVFEVVDIFDVLMKCVVEVGLMLV